MRSLTGGRFQDVEGREWELGARVKIGPWLHLRGGWRKSRYEFTQIEPGVPQAIRLDGEVKAGGFFAGIGIHF